jgi:cytochrome c553
VQTFLRDVLQAPGTPDPAQQSRLTIARFRCQVCHERDGQGGLSADLYAHLTANQTEGEAELVRPPSLTGVARKLHTTALTGVLVSDERSRPWMALRMPRFPKDVMQPFVSQLTTADAIEPDNQQAQAGGATEQQPAADGATETPLAEAGRTLIGSRGFGCIKCHDVRGIPSGGTRGPDLARITRRVRHNWFNHWMTDPQRLEPGTRMPTVFLAGKSPYAEVLDGDPARQRDAMWAYLSAGDELALPEGIESPSVATSAGPLASGRPWVLRTFLPEVSPRSMAIRFGGDVHAAFDAQNCRLAYAWQGDFVDLAASWTHRGGREAGLLGKVIWRAPPGFPWAISLDKSPVAPDFAAQAADIALGGPVPPHDPQPNTRLHFLGYRLPPRGAETTVGPTMRYEVELPGGQRAIFAEAISPVANGDAVGLLREVEIKAPAGATVLLNLVADVKSRELSVTPSEGAPAESASSVPIMTLQDSEGPLVLSVRAAPATASWLAAPEQPGAVLALPCDPADGVARVTLAILRAKDGSPEGLRRVVKSEMNQGRPAR